MASNAGYAYDYLINLGYTPQAAAAAVGHFQQESGPGLNTKALHDVDPKTGQPTGYGIAGWRDDPKNPKAGRKTALMKYARENKLNPDSIDTQLEFFDHENRTTEKAAGDRLRGARSVEEANIAMMGYERPQGYSRQRPEAGHGFSKRLANAKNILSGYTGQDVSNSSIGRNASGPAITDEWVEPDQSTYEDPELHAVVEGEEEPAPEESRLRRGIKALMNMGNQDEEMPFDYTPAGESQIIPEYDPQEGAIPLNAYQSYENYSRGGNVDQRIDPHEFFRMVLGE